VSLKLSRAEGFLAKLVESWPWFSIALLLLFDLAKRASFFLFSLDYALRLK